MSTLQVDFNYGPLTGLIGEWRGDKGTDVAPEPEDGSEVNKYFESIIFSEALETSNAEEQRVSAVHYTQKVQRISTGKVIHQETGYWIWEHETNKIVNALTIPRGLALLAGGSVAEDDNGNLVFDVKSTQEDPNWKLVQSPFLRQKADTKSVQKTFTLKGDSLSYQQRIVVDIYGNEFDHTDENTLTRVK